MHQNRRAGAWSRLSPASRATSLGQATCTGLFVAAIALLVPGLAGAATSVYHSPGDDGGPASGAISMAAGSTQSLNLWIHKGSNASGGDECITGTGDEICAYDVEVNLVGGSSISGWDPDDSSVVGAPSPDGKRLRINRIVDTPGTAPIRIGSLDVTVTGTSGRVEVSGRHIINASQGLEGISNVNVAFVPEPGQLLVLATGLLGLRGLAALRRRR